MSGHGKRKGTAFLSSDLVRAVLKGHSALGLAFAAILYLVCLTGAVSVFAYEFQRWENPNVPRSTAMSADAVQAAYRAGLARAGGAPEHVFILLPSADKPWPTVRIDGSDGGRTTWIADGQGRLVGEMKENWSWFITRLHINLHLPQRWGILIVGLAGVALLSSLISGVLAHPRIFRDAFHLRLGGSRRLQEVDLHNRIGIWALPFHITVSLTGALLGLSSIIIGAIGLVVFNGDTAKVYAIFTPPHPVEDARLAPALDLRPLYAATMAQAPGGRINYVTVEHPLEQGAAAVFEVDDGSSRLANADTYSFDRTGRLYHLRKAASNNLGQQILDSLGPLHFGWFGGGAIKIIYSLLGIGLAYLAAGGVHIWLARRHDKGRPTPTWERVWAACVWGQPMALSAAALASVIWAFQAATVWTWMIASVVAVVAAGFFTPVGLSRLARLATGTVLVLTVVSHLLLTMPGDPVALVMDGALALIGAGLLATCSGRLGRIYRQRRSAVREASVEADAG
ncbi:PepSY-associated TM helix domain-containing protein [Novosphingobium sp. SL115]|uniref:PepSY-associated TM helix domain-containing protein n=1 Tax=Novosphingobium sp. SL115 TaxID=2995150 RepID=UPI002276808D|nr:PepSY-associated TM helix domain-containing protein [Novosphingobium sp. SL115]MCY1672587.1 PepSY-associated TM helix domain-containing protein [Novosphingobium sp. SL115]